MRISGNHCIWLMRAAAVVAVVFGAASIRASGSVLFGDGAQAAGQVVGFVLWFNFFAGFAYIVAGAGLWLRRRWSAWLAFAIAAGTLPVSRRVRHARGRERCRRSAHGMGDDAAQRRVDPDCAVRAQGGQIQRIGSGLCGPKRRARHCHGCEIARESACA